MSIFNRQTPEQAETERQLEQYSAEFAALLQRDQSRTSRMETYRKEAEASREVRPGGGTTSDRDYGRVVQSGGKARNDIQLPLAQVLTIKGAYRIAGRMPDATVERREETEQERYRSDTMEKIFWACIRASGGNTLFLSGAYDGALLGATVLDVFWNSEKQMPQVRRLDPAGVVAVKGFHDPHDFERVYRYWNVTEETARATYANKMFRGELIDTSHLASSHKEGIGSKLTIVEVSTKTTTCRFAVGQHVVGLEEEEHNLGFVPRVIIPNLGPYEDVWGWADYENYRDIAAYIPRLLSREADIIQAVSNGTIIDKGSGQDPGKIARVIQEGGILPVKKEADLSPLDTPETPAFQESHTSRVMDLFERVSFSPPAAWGSGSAGSGSDRGLQLQPQLELTAMKQTNWSMGLSRLGEYAFRMMEKKMSRSATVRGSTYTKGYARGFAPFTLGPDEPSAEMENPAFAEGESAEPTILVPRSPKELFEGDYCIEFTWANRIDPDDPAFVASELNKFAQGTQSARTTMERLGIERPEDELKLIEQEAERFPWLRQGMIRLLQMQFAAEQNQNGAGQGTGGGGDTSGTGGLMDALGGMGGGDTAATDADQMTGGLSGGVGTPYGAA